MNTLLEFIHSMNRQSKLSLPQGWTRAVKSAVLRVISLAHYAILRGRGLVVEDFESVGRFPVDDERQSQEIALLNEELRIKNARMASIPSRRRPHYPPTARMAILELKAARGWSLAQTARRFQLTPATIASWMKRLDEDGPDALVQLPRPVNEFPRFVRYIVERLKVLCPTLGRRKIAEMLARAGLHLSASTVARMIKPEEPEQPSPLEPVLPEQSAASDQSAPRVVTAKRPNHVWHIDLTVVPIAAGFWVSWLPFSLSQIWPFCWWVAAVVDHFSRRIMGTAAFRRQPTSEMVCAFLERTMNDAEATPKYIVCDRGTQFDSEGFRAWCERHEIKPRYGAVGQHGSIAVVERLIRTIKENIQLWPCVPQREDDFRRELLLFVQWYNADRPHAKLGGRTPDEGYFHRFPANRKPRYEPRERWRKSFSCARPWALVRGSPGANVQLDVTYREGRKHLPVVALKRVA